MSDDKAFSQILAGLRAGDEEAAASVFRRFAQRLIALARSRLDTAVRRKVDPEDVLQSAFGSFFRRYSEGQFEVADWNGLWALLVCLTLRKCGHKIAYFHAACRNVDREYALAPDASSSQNWDVLAEDPTPAQAAQLTDTVTQVLDSLREGRERQIVQMCLEGYTIAEISAAVGRSTRTVERVLKRVRRQLERMHSEEAF
jgi:RNA polymerase sigma-70 factor (ECF subfamily)